MKNSLPARCAAALLTLTLAACGTSDGTAGGSVNSASAGDVLLKVISNRADLISGGNALIEVVLSNDADPADVIVNADGLDVTRFFAMRENGRYMGVVQGLPLGENTLTASLPNGRGSRITIDNHPIGGPIFSGPQLQPWLCTTASNGLGEPDDAQCNAATNVELFYRNQAGAFVPYDHSNPPADMSTTTTDEGHTVPYIIRQETGTHNRGIYTQAVLFNPDEEWFPWAPQEQWNGKLHFPFGASCGTVHSQNSAESVQNHRALSRGFMVATSSLNTLGNSCNTTTSAESVMMLKEHIVENFGEIRYTMAEGCSGGSIGQHMIGNNYPGLLQGIQPNCSYMDNWTTGLEVVDCHILLNYYQNNPTGGWSPTQITAVNGHVGPSSCVAWEALFAPVVDPEGGCGLSAGEEYDADTNPTGCRGATMDYNINIIGRRAPELWSDPHNGEATRIAEAIAGGFARFPYDNTGVQYGLQALLDNDITTEQFVHLNENIGSVDTDFNYATGRRVADAGSETLFRAGGVNDALRLDDVAIIDLRGSSNNEIHTDYHSWAMRQRIIDANGSNPNQVIWSFPNALVPTPEIADQAFDLLNAWLGAAEVQTQATNGLPLADVLAATKPSEAVDACFLDGAKVTDMQVCSAAIPYFGSPRLVAGMSISHDVAQCALRPIDRNDYAGALIPMTDAQFARLQAVFPTGVCDYSQPDINAVPSEAWMTFEDGPGLGRPLGDPPVATTF